jgi:NADH-quinone oxidoreductase subunit A
VSADPLIAITVGFGVTLAALLATLWIARVAMTGPEHPLKRVRYEAGNPPRGEARSALPPQYYGYVLIFLVVDTLYALLFLLVFSGAPAAMPWIIIATALLLPPLAYALKYARKLEEWA